MIVCFCACWSFVRAADSFSLANGTTLTGDIIFYNGAGIRFMEANDQDSGMISWPQFSQDGLQHLAQNPKIRPYVDPFLDLPPPDNAQPSDNIKIQEVTHLDRLVRHSLLGGLLSSSVGTFLLLLIYLANFYAAFEVANCRARPLSLVMGISAVLPVIGPALFYLLPLNPQAVQSEGDLPAAGHEAGTEGAPDAAGVADDAHAPQQEEIHISAIHSTISQLPPDQVFKRGQFTFNRRFVETKFAGFIAPVRSEADKNLDFIVKLPQGTFVVERISNIGANDLSFAIIQDQQSQEITVPFADILEVTLKAKSA